MNLIVSIRAEDDYLRFDAQGQWHYNDALALAYQVKAVASRERMRHILIDLQAVTPSPRVEGKFLVWDRLMRLARPGRAGGPAHPPAGWRGHGRPVQLRARRDPLARRNRRGHKKSLGLAGRGTSSRERNLKKNPASELECAAFRGFPHAFTPLLPHTA
jgi:hypothetical protein